jgi:2-iminobutanoate/2-iminopropanoate deaminase
MHQTTAPADVFEPVTGLYHQVLRVTPGTTYEIAGTLPYSPDGVMDDALTDQCHVVMANMGRSLASVGLGPEHVTRIRVYTTRMDEFLQTSLDIVFKWFGPTSPPSTLVEVARLANPRCLVEIDATAVGPAQESE